MSAMAKTIADWDNAAADAFTHLNERKRDYPKKTMLSFLDDLVMKGSSTQAEMIEKHGPVDLIATTLGHVTTAIHGPGRSRKWAVGIAPRSTRTLIMSILNSQRRGKLNAG
jgi:hypothetical protein